MLITDAGGKNYNGELQSKVYLRWLIPIELIKVGLCLWESQVRLWHTGPFGFTDGPLPNILAPRGLEAKGQK